jgi:hemerythrin superfamily protein
MIGSVQDILTVDHVELDRLLNDAFAALDASDSSAAFSSLDLFWARLAVHIRAEHLRLFPTVLKWSEHDTDESDKLSTIIKTLHSDHDYFMHELARAVKAMRLVFSWGNERETFIIVKELLEGVRSRLVEHNLVEENEVYALVDRKDIEAGERARLAADVLAEIRRMPPRFALDHSG